MSDEQTALVPITELLPELRAADYAIVRAWDEARMQLAGEYEATDGEYLTKIQAKLAPVGLFGAYLKARNVAMTTAQYRIAKAQGRPYTYQPISKLETPRSLLPEPEPESPQDTAVVPRDELARLENMANWANARGYGGEIDEYGEWSESDEDEEASEPEQSTWPSPIDDLPADEDEAQEESNTIAWSDVTRAIEAERGKSPEGMSIIVGRYLMAVDGYAAITDDNINAWLDVTPTDMWHVGMDTLLAVRTFIDHFESLLEARRRVRLRVME